MDSAQVPLLSTSAMYAIWLSFQAELHTLRPQKRYINTYGETIEEAINNAEGWILDRIFGSHHIMIKEAR